MLLEFVAAERWPHGVHSSVGKADSTMMRLLCLTLLGLLLLPPCQIAVAQNASFDDATRAPYSDPPEKSINGKSNGETATYELLFL